MSGIGPAPTPSQAQCPTCRRTFGGVTGFDRHRRNGACLDPVALGMTQDGKGVWRSEVAARPSHWAAAATKPSFGRSGKGEAEKADHPRIEGVKL